MQSPVDLRVIDEVNQGDRDSILLGRSAEGLVQFIVEPARTEACRLDKSEIVTFE